MFSRVYVEITNICNMNCSFCHGHKRDKKSMSKGDFLRVLDALQGKTKHIYYHLMGEPFVHPELGEFIALANECGFKSLITTNGTLLKKKGKEILESGIYKINISLHSFEEDNEEREEKYLKEIVDFTRLAWERGVIVVLRLWNKGRDGGKNEKIIDFLRGQLDGEWEENDKGIKIKNRLHIEWGERFIWPDANGEYIGEEVFCYGMRDHFGILVDGSVVPCCLDSEGAITLGNLFEEELSKILSSPRAKAIKQGFGSKKATEDLCRKCPYARRFK